MGFPTLCLTVLLTHCPQDLVVPEVGGPADKEEWEDRRILMAPLRRPFPADAGLGLAGQLVGDERLDLLRDGSILRQIGSTEFRHEHDVPQLAHALGLIDFDQDGDDDVVVDGVLYRNDGAGAFTLFQTLIIGYDATDLHVADFDLDGRPDILLSETGETAELFLNRTSSFVAFPQAILKGPLGARGLVVADLDDKLGPDLFLISKNVAGGLEVLFNDGTGAFALDTTRFPAPPPFLTDAAAADVDGDLDLDVVVIMFGDPEYYLDAEIALYLNDGTGIFSDAPVAVPDTEFFPDRIHALDIELDGDPDLYLTNGVREQLGFLGYAYGAAGAPDELLINDGSGVFSFASPGLFPATYERAEAEQVTDVNADGYPDVLVSGAHNRILLNQKDGSFTHLGQLPASGTIAEPMDLTGNGFPDVFTEFGVLLNDPPGQLELGSVLPPFHNDASDVAFGDVDGDGDQDAVVTIPLDDGYQEPQNNHLLLNDGTGTFTDVTSSRLPTFLPYERGTSLGVELADIDGDTDIDILVLRDSDYDGGGSGITTYVNDGSGTFTSEFRVPPATGEPDAFTMGDVDADGDLDILQGALYQHGVSINDGAGFFSFLPGFPDPGPFNAPHEMHLVDFDTDGDLDAYVVDQMVRYYENLGSGTWTRDDDPGLPRVDPATFGDFDGDGDPDLFGTDELWLNDGGEFTDHSQRVDFPPAADAVRVADLDGDGDLDALYRKDGQLEITWNLERQVARRSQPVIGRSLVLDVYGTPHTRWFLFTATSFSVGTAGPQGLPLLGAAPRPASRGVLNHAGRGLVRLRIPNDANLIGVETYWQALVGSPLAWTNLEVATIQDR